MGLATVKESAADVRIGFNNSNEALGTRDDADGLLIIAYLSDRDDYKAYFEDPLPTLADLLGSFPEDQLPQLIYIMISEKGAPLGVATLDADGNVSQPITIDNLLPYLQGLPGYANGKELAVYGGVIAWQTPGSFQDVLPTVATFTPAAGDGKITFTFSAVTGASGYTVQASANGQWDDLVSVTASSPTQITGLTNGVPYHIRIRGNASGKISGQWKTSPIVFTPKAAI